MHSRGSVLAPSSSIWLTASIFVILFVFGALVFSRQLQTDDKTPFERERSANYGSAHVHGEQEQHCSTESMDNTLATNVAARTQDGNTGTNSGSCMTALRHAPDIVRNICGRWHRDAVMDIARFFEQPQPALRVAFVDAEARNGRGSIERSLCTHRFNKTVMGSGWTSSDFAHKFAAELLIPRGMRNSRFVSSVSVPDADYVLVQFCNIGTANNGHTLRDIPSYMTTHKDTAVVWRDKRHRVLLTLTGDHGPCIQSNEKANQIKERQWIDDTVRGATLLMNEGSKLGKCYNAQTDVVIPTSAIITEQGSLQCPPTKQSHLIFFAGKLDSRVRRDLIKTFKTDPDFYLPDTLTPGNDYLCAMAASTFCLAPRGNAAWSPRLDEALYAGCIPVLLADAYDPPFSSLLNYSTFSLTFPEGGISDLGRQLAAVPMATRRRLLEGGAAVRPFFRYASYIDLGHTGDASTKIGIAPRDESYDATTLVVIDLWRKICTR